MAREEMAAWTIMVYLAGDNLTTDAYSETNCSDSSLIAKWNRRSPHDV